jgi:ABC-type transport system involved in multi-copper enzyme maturation permease subunit
VTALTATRTASRPEGTHPWLRLTWITWRQHRGALSGFAALFAAFALLMLYVGLKVHSAYAALLAHHCTVATTLGPCAKPAGLFLGQPYDLTANGVGLALHVSPVLIGMFLGAPLLAREYESGTLRFAWTQGTGRIRWAATQIALLAAAIAAVTCGLAVLAAWVSQPFAALGYESRWQAGQFDTTVITAVGWALAAFALGTLLGALTKRTVAAMAATAAVVSALAVATYWKLDYLLLSVHTRTVADLAMVEANFGQRAINTYAQQAYPGPPGSWLVHGYLADAKGRPLGEAAVEAATRRLFSDKPSAGMRWLAQHHDTFLVAYQPAARYWLLNSVAGITLSLIAAALMAATLILIRRRHT